MRVHPHTTRRLLGAGAVLMACVLLATSLSAEDTPVNERVAKAIARTRKVMRSRFNRAATALRQGKPDVAQGALVEAATTLRAGAQAGWLILGAKPPELPKLREVPSAAAPSVATPTPATPAPKKPAHAGAYALSETHDRFTGAAKVRVAVAKLTGLHKDTRQAGTFLLQFEVSRPEQGASTCAFFFGSDDVGFGMSGPVAKGERATALYLIDGKRSRKLLPAVTNRMDGSPFQVVAHVMSLTAAEAYFAAKKVELRLGGHELVVPADYRAAARAAVKRLAKLPR